MKNRVPSDRHYLKGHSAFKQRGQGVTHTANNHPRGVTPVPVAGWGYVKVKTP